jgi:hypothetical protein
MIEVNKRTEEEFTVTVTEEDKVKYIVTLDDEYYKDLTRERISKEELIKKSFKFLLKRERKESILSRFNLKVINRYFPEFEKEIKA